MEQMLLPILMFAGLGGMMYFGMRKQKRVAAATREMHDSLVPGARVMTTSGLHGTVTAVADDTIELEIAPGLRTTWVAPRSARSSFRSDGATPRRSSTRTTRDSIDARTRPDRLRHGPQIQRPELSSAVAPARQGRGIIMWGA